MTDQRTCYDLFHDHLEGVDPGPEEDGLPRPHWFLQHRNAWHMPKRGPERAIHSLIEGYALLADAHQTEDRTLGQDGYFHEHAKDLIDAMRAALNFDMGRLDCGALDKLICALAKASGVELDP